MLIKRYIELLKDSLLNEHYIELEAQLLFSILCSAHQLTMDLPEFLKVRNDENFLKSLKEAKSGGDTVILETSLKNGKQFADSNLRNYTEFAYTLVGRKRLDHLQDCVETIIRDKIEGDLVEAGVWRGGCCILIKGILEAHACHNRNVWLCDSFSGLPKSRLNQDQAFKMDADIFPFLAVEEEEVRSNFNRFNLLDSTVKFLPGFFNTSLVNSPIENISLLRIDADLYESTMDVLINLYPQVTEGGYLIIDDYGILPPCREAVDRFRSDMKIKDPIQKIDEHAVYWRVSGLTS